MEYCIKYDLCHAGASYQVTREDNGYQLSCCGTHLTRVVRDVAAGAKDNTVDVKVIRGL